MNVSVPKNLQNFVHRTVKHLTGRFSVMYRRLEMPLEGRVRPAFSYIKVTKVVGENNLI